MDEFVYIFCHLVANVQQHSVSFCKFTEYSSRVFVSAVLTDVIKLTKHSKAATLFSMKDILK